jgi:plasmid maintenance system antidote protein VapI
MNTNVNHNVHYRARDASINFAFMTPGEKFTAALEESRFTPAQFARLMNVEDQAIQNWKRRGVPGKLCFDIARHLGKDPEWLVRDDKDLPSDFTPDAKAEEDRAVALFQLLSDSQRELVEKLVLEFVRK